MDNTSSGKRNKRKDFLTEGQIRQVVDVVMTNKAAALYLSVSDETWKKYSSAFRHPNTNETYYEFLKHKRTRTQTKKTALMPLRSLPAILEGKVPTYDKEKLLTRLLNEGHFLPVCSLCGYCEKNIVDNTVPLVLDCVDGDQTNFRKGNLQILCYNCAFQMGYEFKIKKT